ncbi:HTH_Tnp_Tc3_2 domain-containing protein [Trichonephila clavipes]|nr:HTH_Tnp_Tc3_2 domain-containing protein [Trichonephila clavipes]
MDFAPFASTNGFRQPSTYESTIAQGLPLCRLSCLDWRAQRLEWKRVARSPFRLLNADGRLKLWRQAHEAMDPACQIGTVQVHGGSIMVHDLFSWHCLGSLVRPQ